jgi:hypothetical protein
MKFEIGQKRGRPSSPMPFTQEVQEISPAVTPARESLNSSLGKENSTSVSTSRPQSEAQDTTGSRTNWHVSRFRESAEDVETPILLPSRSHQDRSTLTLVNVGDPNRPPSLEITELRDFVLPAPPPIHDPAYDSRRNSSLSDGVSLRKSGVAKWDSQQTLPTSQEADTTTLKHDSINLAAADTKLLEDPNDEKAQMNLLQRGIADDSNLWTPKSLHIVLIAFPLVVFIFLIPALETISTHSHRNNGLGSWEPRQRYLWTMGPPACM